MYARNAPGAKQQQPETPTSVSPEPSAPRAKVEMRDSRAFSPSTFATRKLAADRANAERGKRRLVSLGPSEFKQRTSDGDTELVDVELYADVDTGDRFVLFPHAGGLVALQADSGNTDSFSPLPPLRQGLRRPAASKYEPSPADPPQRTV